MKASRIVSFGFLISLSVLLLNDYVLKSTFPGLVTGKLSDFAGLFAFPMFFSELVRSRKREIYALTFVGFVLWKMPACDGVLNLLNSLSSIHFSRVQDYSDYIAMVVLPFSYAYRPRCLVSSRSPLVFAKVLLSGIAVFSFVGTAGGHQSISTYKLICPKKLVRTQMSEFFLKRPMYIVPKDHQSVRMKNSSPLSSNELRSPDTDSTNFYFWATLNYRTPIIVWVAIQGGGYNWDRGPTEICLMGFSHIDGSFSGGSNLSYLERKALIDWFESKVVVELKNSCSSSQE